jgi:protein-S-isoprenylcysteine O-methyltransferase Ste14
VSEETGDPSSNSVERQAMEAPARKRQTGQALVLIGVLLLTFDLILAVFVPSDLRAGHRFWVVIFTADVIAAMALIVIGTVQKSKAKVK